ncbi:MAG: DUF2252 family protein [bacterium]
MRLPTNNIFYLLVLILCFIQIDCACDRNQSDDRNPLYVDSAGNDFSENPDLLDRIRATPHGYLRFINIQFSGEVCNRFRDVLPRTPSFNLHGDAHLEQYAVTDLGRGLTDYDDSSTGPAFLDIMRFGVSLHLACLAYNWEAHSDSLFDEFLRGYRLALQDPTEEAPEPKVVTQIRSKFKYDRTAYFNWVESISDSISPTEQEELTEALKPYIGSMIAEQPHLSEAFFKIEKMGYLKLGIGSALDLKYLVRLRGKSDDPLDDVILEIKEVRDISGIECLDRPFKENPYRVLLGQARIAYQPFKFLGYIRLRGQALWIHSWVDNYKEVKIGKTFESVEELREVVFDIGIQLGRGHPKQIASPLDLQLRQEQLRLLSQYEKRIKETRKELAGLTIEAWGRFCAQVK